MYVNSKRKPLQELIPHFLLHFTEVKVFVLTAVCGSVFLGGEDRFEVERDTGWIKMTGLPLVRNKEYLLTVLAADKLGNKGSPASVSIIAGFRPPQFSNMSYFVYVPESMAQGKS